MYELALIAVGFVLFPIVVGAMSWLRGDDAGLLDRERAGRDHPDHRPEIGN